MGLVRPALLIVVAAHLGLVGATVLGLDLRDDPADPAPARAARRVMAEYAALSGASSQYGFFAGGVDRQVRPSLEVTDRAGAVTTEPLERKVDVEVDLRVANLVSLLWWGDEEIERALLASWASASFARHPGAEQVGIGLDLYELPSMAEYRAGRRPWWHRVDRMTFSPPSPSGARGATEVGG